MFVKKVTLMIHPYVENAKKIVKNVQVYQIVVNVLKDIKKHLLKNVNWIHNFIILVIFKSYLVVLLLMIIVILVNLMLIIVLVVI